MTPTEGALSSGLRRVELAAYVERFGVAEEQVRRDHLISVLLAALSASPLREQVVFFGGTALSRTHLVDHRLSEDIDLIALAPRADLVGSLERVFDRAVARTHGQTNWQPALPPPSAHRPRRSASRRDCACRCSFWRETTTRSGQLKRSRSSSGTPTCVLQRSRP